MEKSFVNTNSREFTQGLLSDTYWRSFPKDKVRRSVKVVST
jgi:hypothetical protein